MKMLALSSILSILFLTLPQLESKDVFFIADPGSDYCQSKDILPAENQTAGDSANRARRAIDETTNSANTTKTGSSEDSRNENPVGDPGAPTINPPVNEKATQETEKPPIDNKNDDSSVDESSKKDVTSPPSANIETTGKAPGTDNVVGVSTASPLVPSTNSVLPVVSLNVTTPSVPSASSPSIIPPSPDPSKSSPAVFDNANSGTVTLAPQSTAKAVEPKVSTDSQAQNGALSSVEPEKDGVDATTVQPVVSRPTQPTQPDLSDIKSTTIANSQTPSEKDLTSSATPSPINDEGTESPKPSPTTQKTEELIPPYQCTLNESSTSLKNISCYKVSVWAGLCAMNCYQCDQTKQVCLPFKTQSSSINRWGAVWQCREYSQIGSMIKDDVMCLDIMRTRECSVPVLPSIDLTPSIIDTNSMKFDYREDSELVQDGIPYTEPTPFWKKESAQYCIRLATSQSQLPLKEADEVKEPNQPCNSDGVFKQLNPAVCYEVTLTVIYSASSQLDQRQKSRVVTNVFCTIPKAPSTVPSPEIEASGMTITIHRPPQSQGRVECYYVVLFRMTLTETIEDIQVQYLDQHLGEFRSTGTSKNMEKLRPYVTMAIKGFEEDSQTFAFNTQEDQPVLSSCGVCQNVTNAQLLPGRYLIVVEAAVESSHVQRATCGHNANFTKKSSYISLNYVLPKESQSTMWIPITILTTILILSLIVLSLLFITRNRRCEGMQIFSKLRFGEDVNDSAFIENNPYSNQLMGSGHGNGGSVSSRNNQNLALLPVNTNGFNGMVNPNHPQHMSHNNSYTQIDPQKRMQADNDFKIALIEEYGPEYLEDRRKCVIEMTTENAKDFVERKCTTPHFYYTFYKSRALPCPGQPLEPEPKYHEMSQWDFEFERIAHDGYMEGEVAPPQVLNDPSVIKINKFSDVCPYEFNRVKLTHGIKDNPNRDRTNGSLIQFPSLGLHTRFIAIQGPDQPYYINQFWQIVYEYNCDVIVMLASFNVSSGKDGVQYWPDFDDHEGATQVYGNYTVTMTDKRSIYSYMDHRVFQVTFTPANNNYETGSQTGDNTTEGDNCNADDEVDGMNKQSSQSDSSRSSSTSSANGGGASEPGETKVVHHFHFTMWNDYGIPTDTSSFWSFMDTAMAYHDSPSPQSPVLVHCRAGIGRTGTFIASHYLRELLERDRKVDVHSFVWQLRAQRKKFVQKVCQYRFIHQALLEHILFTPCRMQLSSLETMSTNSHTFKSTVLRQLQSVEFVEKYREHHLEKEKGDYNGREETFPRDIQKVPFKYNFVRFPADIIHEVYSSYLNASWMCGYNDELRKFIVTDLPYEVKHKTFWWMILQHKISYIVYIGDLPTDGQKKEKPYWPDIEGQVMKFGRINVTLLSKKGFMPNEHDEDDDLISHQDDGDNDHMMNGVGSPAASGRHAKSGSSASPNSYSNTRRTNNPDSYTAIIRQLVLTVTDDDENLSKGEEWYITHVQYLLLEGATGPPSSPAHFAHFVTLLRNNLIGGVRDETGKFSHLGVCNCSLKRGGCNRDSMFNRSGCSSDGHGGVNNNYSNISEVTATTQFSSSCDCSKPLVVQCLTGGVRSALLCAIWMLSVDLEQTKSCNVPSVIHRLLEQRSTIFPCCSANNTDIDCFK
ncbi:uncharacterized protein LOC142338038, partial [Convolutriloba macropyga]|uniref:uncharacterized protein LOC142338038 n=1 Tax=Convolutriloba macropyga TaxID=536237 RepID=UPI003F522359